MHSQTGTTKVVWDHEIQPKFTFFTPPTSEANHVAEFHRGGGGGA